MTHVHEIKIPFSINKLSKKFAKLSQSLQFFKSYKVKGTSNMCQDFFKLPKTIVKEIIEEFINQNKTFTAFDVTTELHERLRHQNIRSDIHQVIQEDNRIDYQQGTVQGKPVIEYTSCVDKNDDSDSTDSVDLTNLKDFLVPLLTKKDNLQRIPKPNTNIVKVNASGRLCVPKAYTEMLGPKGTTLYITLSNTKDITIYCNSMVAPSNSIPLKVDRHGYLPIRGKHLTADTYKVTPTSIGYLVLTPQ